MQLGFYFYKQQTTGQAFHYSIDFTGGTQLLLRFEKPVSSVETKQFYKGGWSGAVTRDKFGPTEVLIRVREFINDAKGLTERIVAAIEKGLPNNKVMVLESEAVGAGGAKISAGTLSWQY